MPCASDALYLTPQPVAVTVPSQRFQPFKPDVPPMTNDQLRAMTASRAAQADQLAAEKELQTRCEADLQEMRGGNQLHSQALGTAAADVGSLAELEQSLRDAISDLQAQQRSLDTEIAALHAAELQNKAGTLLFQCTMVVVQGRQMC